jgi:hypothetical protein
MSKQTIRINASSLASVAGFNKYETTENIVSALVQKNPFLVPKLVKVVKKDTVYNYVEKLSKEDKIIVSSTLDIEGEPDIALLEKAIVDKINDLKLKSNNEESRLEFDLEDNKFNCLFESEVRMQIGNVKEESDINEYEKKFGKKVDKRNTETYSKIITTYKEYDVEIRAKIDGISDGKVVETKHRRNRLLGIPIYEKVQMECYMWILDYTTSIHVENYVDKQSTVMYHQDTKFWNEIVTKLNLFLNDHF